MQKSGKCILSCDDGKMCINDSTETFKEVICPYHLAQVFGLKVDIELMDKESVDYFIGPYLILDNSFSFEANTVVFPERSFIDQRLNMKDDNGDFYLYKLNPRMDNYLMNLYSGGFKLSKSEIRYQLEVIRNLFFTSEPQNTNSINLAKDTELSNKSLLVNIEKRFRELDTTIINEDYHKIFKNIQIMSTSDDKIMPLDTFTPFMKFLLFNCLTDEHKLPTTPESGVGITAYANLMYKKGVGFITLHDLMHPNKLVVSGVTVGNNNYYQLKIRSINKRTIQNNTAMYKKNLADNLRASNVLNPQSDFCWSRRY